MPSQGVAVVDLSVMPRVVSNRTMCEARYRGKGKIVHRRGFLKMPIMPWRDGIRLLIDWPRWWEKVYVFV